MCTHCIIHFPYTNIQVTSNQENEVAEHSSLDDFRIEIEEKNMRLIELETKINDLEVNIKDSKVLKMELEKKDNRIRELEVNVTTLEQIFKQQDTINEFEELFEVIRIKDDRIEELEDALRESINITTERELVLEAEEQKRKQIMEKVRYYLKGSFDICTLVIIKTQKI